MVPAHTSACSRILLPKEASLRPPCPGAPSSVQGSSFPKAKCPERKEAESLALYSQQESASALRDGVGRAGRHFLGGRGWTPCNP